MTIQQAMDEFFIEQQIRGNTPKTIRYYSLSLGQYTAYANPDTLMSEIDLKSLKGFYIYLSGRNLASTSIQTYIRALRAFLRWCYAEEYIPVNLAEKFRLPKAKQKTVDVLSESEIHQLFSCFNLRYLVQLRNYCICILMLDSGLRMNEVTTLSVEHLHIPEGYAIVDGKGNKQRIVPLGLHSRKMLSRYLSRRPACASTDRVFLMSDMRPITNNTIHLLFQRLKTRASIPRIHAHLLRHTFATRYLENGGDMYALQQILGHTSLEMVKRYVHSTTGRLIPSYSLYSPMDNLLKK